MIIDNIIVIAVAIILITYLSINYVKKYSALNLLVIAIVAFCVGVYLPVVIYGVNLRVRYQIPVGIGIFVLPCIVAILQYNNITFGKNLLFKKAEAAFNNQKYSKCESLLLKYISKEGRTQEAVFLLAKCYYANKEYQEAKEYIYEVVEKDSQNYEAYYILGRILELEEDIDSAIDMYQKCVDIKPTYYDAYESLGILLADQGKYEEAEKVYRKAIEYHTESYELLFNLAMIQLELGKTDDAEKNLELALVINPEINDAIYTLGNIKLLKGQYNDALSLYSEITKTEDYGLKAYYKIAVIYVTKNEIEKAISVIEYLINEDESYVQKIRDEFIFNSIRSKIDSMLTERENRSKELVKAEETEIEAIRDTRKSWFGRNRFEQIDDSLNYDDNNSILYNDIDMSKTGFRNQEENK